MSVRRRALWLTGGAVLLVAAHVGGEPRPETRPPASRIHVVGRGDTLGGIAARYKISVAALVAANHLASERVVLRLGQRLLVPPPAPVLAPTAGRHPASEATPLRSSTHAATSAAGRVTTRRPAPSRLTILARGPLGLELAVPDFVDAAPAFTWPVDGAVTSIFGRRHNAWHRGIDIKAEPGAVVLASAAGVVATADTEPRYGRVVKIEHDDGFVTVYAHNEENLVQAGMRVLLGDPIATIGRSGRATAYHLHFEIRRNGSVYNPLYLLPVPPRVGQVEEGAEPGEEHE